MARRAKTALKKQAAVPTRAPVMGLDFGTSSVRAVVVDALTGQALSSVAKDYPHGVNGVIVSASNPHLARQDPQDYGDAMQKAMRAAMNKARIKHKMNPATLRAVGVSATGSTPIPMNNRTAIG